MININKIKTYSVKQRYSKVSLSNAAKPLKKGKSFLSFFNSLPNILKANDIRFVADAVAGARRKKRSVIFMAGAHIIKCGLNPVVIELMRKKAITCVCLNGAGIIHDFETAFLGKTSEDVGCNLKDGSFGMARETASFLNESAKEGVLGGLGLGYAIASSIAKAKLPYENHSLLFNAYKYKVPVCIFIAVGTDIIHQHPSFNAALTAEGSYRDFKLFTENVSRLNEGGVVLNFGSAVILPEVFLKALNLSRNLGYKVKNFTTANFDMLYHYRPAQNVVIRPVQCGGKGFYIVGHHEIMLPLLAQAILEKI